MDDTITERFRPEASDRGRVLTVRPSVDDASDGYWRRLGNRGEDACLSWNALVADPAR